MNETSLDQVWEALEDVKDPEIPTVSVVLRAGGSARESAAAVPEAPQLFQIALRDLGLFRKSGSF